MKVTCFDIVKRTQWDFFEKPFCVLKIVKWDFYFTIAAEICQNVIHIINQLSKNTCKQNLHTWMRIYTCVFRSLKPSVKSR